MLDKGQVHLCQPIQDNVERKLSSEKPWKISTYQKLKSKITDLYKIKICTYLYELLHKLPINGLENLLDFEKYLDLICDDLF